MSNLYRELDLPFDDRPVTEPTPPPTEATSGRKVFTAADRSPYLKWRFESAGARNAPRYGITEARFWEIVAEQEGRCPICRAVFSAAGPMMVIDHNHETGEVRGVLCSACNLSLGAFGDSPDRLRAALAYLAKRGCYGRDEGSTA